MASGRWSFLAWLDEDEAADVESAKVVTLYAIAEDRWDLVRYLLYPLVQCCTDSTPPEMSSLPEDAKQAPWRSDLMHEGQTPLDIQSFMRAWRTSVLYTLQDRL